MLFVTLLCLATSCLLVAWWRHRVRLLRATRNIPMTHKQVPLLGSSYRFIGDNLKQWETLKEISNEINGSGGILSAWFGPTTLSIGITDPGLSAAVSNACLNKSSFYSWAKLTVGEGIGTCSNVDLWKNHRKLLNPAFNQNVLNNYLEIFNRQSRKLVTEFLEYVDSGKFNPRPCIAKTSLETICQTAMGLPENKACTVDNVYQETVDKLLHHLSKRMGTLWKYPQIIYDLTPDRKESYFYCSIFQKKSRDVLEKSKIEMKDKIYNNSHENEALGSRYKPFIQLLLEWFQSGQLSDQEIIDEVNTMIAAGYETTASTLVLTLIIIGSHEVVQEKIYAELQETFSDTDRDVTKEDIPKLVYLEAVIKECLRLYPVIPMISRVVDKDVQIGDITFPRGAEVFISIWGINRHPCWGADRNEFNPDRWLSPDTLPSNPNAFASFAMGKRNCIGKTYAMMSAKVFLAHILRKYQVKADYTKLKFAFEFRLKPVDGDVISVKLR